MTFRLWSFYLRVKTREEGTSRYGIRRHVDLIDDHCHASWQMGFLLAIRRFEVRSRLLSSRSSSLVQHRRDTSRRGQHVRARLYQTYLSARSASKYCDHVRVLVDLHSTGEIISGSALGKPEELGTRRGQKLAREEAINGSRYRRPVMAQELLAYLR